MEQINFDKVDAMASRFTDYAKTLKNADRIQLAAYLLTLVNAVQQHADITQDDMFHARETTTLFNDVDRDDPMDPGYHLHNMLENLSDEFYELADVVSQNVAAEEEDEVEFD